MNKIPALFFFLVTSIGTAYAGGVSSTPNILNSIDEKSLDFLLTDERSATRGEAFHASLFKAATTKAREWCEGRGHCYVVGNLVAATAYDVRNDRSIIIKSY
jgi:hypothetical protein